MADAQAAKRNQEAAQWVVRLSSDQRTRADEAAFREWVAADERYAEAYAEHHALWAGIGGLSENEEARAILLPHGTHTPAPSIWTRRGFVIGSAGTVAAGLTAAVVAPPLLNMDRYETAPGEQKTLHLADGSTVVLNTASNLRVELRKGERRLFLDQGQAFFQVAKDASRPFRVFVGSYEVRALGTAFDVRKVGDNARVTLEEGKVAIFHESDSHVEAAPSGGSQHTASKPEAVLKPGQQAVIASAEPIAVNETDVRKTEAWRNGQIVLDGTALDEIVSDINRYGGPQIVLSDPRLNGIHVSGVFHTGRPDVFVDAITTAFPVRVIEQTPEKIVLAPR